MTSPYLTLQSDSGTSRLPLAKGKAWRIGRGGQNTLPLLDNCASRHHAGIRLIGSGKYYIMDWGSRNGTYVNGKRIITPQLLQHNDQISIGETVLEFHADLPPSTGHNTNFDPNTLEKSRLATVLAVDIRNYGKLLQQISERTLSEIIAKWFSTALDIAEKYNSVIDQLLGDAFIAIWIHDLDSEIPHIPITEIIAAFRTLQDLQNLCEELNTQYQLSLPLSLGAGINTDHICAQNILNDCHSSRQTSENAILTAIHLELACRDIALDVAIAESTHGRTPYANVLLPFKQYFVNSSHSPEPTLTYAGTFEAINQFIDKVSFVLAE